MSRHRQGKSLIYGSISSMLILAEAAARSFSEAPSQIAPTSLSCVWGPNLFVRIFSAAIDISRLADQGPTFRRAAFIGPEVFCI